MRPVTRNHLAALVLVVVALLALGAVPSLLQSGDPYYLTATVVADADTTNATGGNATANATRPAVDVTNLSERRFPYTTAALVDGRSEAYYRGPFGLKESFSHSPFDELDALRQRDRNATDGEAVHVRDNATVYRLAVRRDT